MDTNQDKKLCAWCGKDVGTDIHHLFKRSTSPQLKEDPNNMVLLCRLCHTYADEPQFAELLVKTFFLQERPQKITLEYIAQQLTTRKFFSPAEIVQFRNFIAGEYYFQSTTYADAELEKAQLAVANRDKFKHKTDLEDWLNIQDCGKNAIACHRLLNALEQLQSALFTQHRQFEKEAKNQM